MVLSAILIPVLLVLTAFVYDGGTWFTHKRQLQNRADAAALAAGYQLGIDWPACDGDATTKLAAETRIDNAARQYAGDPEKAGALSLHNTELTDQNRVNVEVNSKAPGGHVDPGTSWNDLGVGGLGPCDDQTTPDRFSPLASVETPAHWVDVGVRERDQRSLFGMFGVDLFRNEAHARVEMKTVAAGKGFLPLAIPDQIIAQAEIRYYRYCPGESPVQIGQPITLQPLADGSGGSNDYQPGGGSSLWGPTTGNQKNGDPTGVQLTLPEEKTCGGNYIPIRAEVRVAGVEKNVIDIDAAGYNGPSGCALLALQRYADCWSELSEIRLDKENPKSEPWFHEVVLSTGTGGCAPDAYFARLPVTDPPTTSCSFSASVKVNWNGYGTTPPAGRICTISVGGTTTDSAGCVSGVFNFSASDSALGRSDLTVTWDCTDQDPKFPGNPSKRIQCPGAAGPTPIKIRSQFLGNRANSSLVTLVRTSRNAQAPGGNPGAPMDWYPAPQGSTEDITIYPTVGLESALYVGQHRTLRAPHCKNGTNSNNCDLDTSSPGDSQSIDCEPGGGTGGQGHDFGLFANGCRPWYDSNTFKDTNWWPCPGSLSYNIANPAASTPPNGTNTPWHCVVKAPGFSPNVISDGIAAAIGNCRDVKSNSCNKYDCVNPNYYDPTNADEWSLQGGKPSPRVIFIFVVPYGAYKNTGPQETIPLLTFAAFYVTGWSGQGGSGKNPCEDSKNLPDPDAIVDEDTKGGDIAGYFVGYTMPDAPGDPHSVCVHDQLKPCTPVLVR